jgi:hypothetical protein
MKLVTLGALLGAAAVFSRALPVAACVAPPLTYTLDGASPAPGDTDVPLNKLRWLLGRQASRPLASGLKQRAGKAPYSSSPALSSCRAFTPVQGTEGVTDE